MYPSYLIRRTTHTHTRGDKDNKELFGFAFTIPLNLFISANKSCNADETQ